MSEEFDVATEFTGEYFSPKESIGALLLFRPVSYRDKETDPVVTTFGNKDAVVTDIVNIDTGEEFASAQLLQGGLIGALKSRVKSPTHPNGRPLLGVLGLGEAKKNQKPPFIILPPSEDQVKQAKEFLANGVIAAATEPTKADDPWA
jgi:hypothetical protein